MRGMEGPGLEGVVTDVQDLAPEPPDTDVARLLFNGLLVVDGVAIALLATLWLLLAVTRCALGLLFNAILVVMFIVILASILRLRLPLGGLLGGALSLMSLPVRALGWLVNLLALRSVWRGPRERVPVANYRVRRADGSMATFRVKGQLQGATLREGDRVRVWGRARHGILHFQGGVKLDTGEPLALPPSYSGWLLAGLLLVNTLALFLLFGGGRGLL